MKVSWFQRSRLARFCCTLCLLLKILIMFWPCMFFPLLHDADRWLMTCICSILQKAREARIVMSQPPEEERAHGRITMKTYYKYFTTERGHLFTLLMVVTFILAEVREHSLVLCTWINHNLLPCVQYAQIHGYAFGCILYACACDQNCPFILIWSNIFTKRVQAAHSSTLYDARVVR